MSNEAVFLSKIEELKEFLNSSKEIPSSLFESDLTNSETVITKTRLVYHTSAPLDKNYAELERHSGRDSRRTTEGQFASLASTTDGSGFIRFY